MITIQAYEAKYNLIFNYLAILDMSEEQKNQVRFYAKKKSSLVPIAVYNHKVVVGFAIGFIENNYGWILGIYVNENFRYKGVGKQLIGYLEQQVSNIHWKIRLKPKFRKFIPFFESANYTVIETLNLYLTNNLTFSSANSHFLQLNGIIRPAVKTDIKELMQIESQSFDSYWHNTFDEWISLITNKKINLVNVFEIEIDFVKKKIIGYNYNSLYGHHEAQYIRIATSKAYRRKNVAHNLTAAAFQWFREKNVHSIHLSTIKSNLQLNKMYQRWGFIKYGEETILANYTELTNNID